jgi:hypothetical protein
MDIDASRLRRGEVIAGASAVVLFLAMFVAWYGYRVKTVSLKSFDIPAPSQDAWNAFSVVDIYLLLTVVVALALTFTQASRRSPAMPVSLSVIASVLGALATLLILFRIVDPPGISGLPSPLASLLASHLERTLKAGVWLGLLSAIGITAGAYLSMREEGIKATDGPREIETVSLVGSNAGST